MKAEFEVPATEPDYLADIFWEVAMLVEHDFIAENIIFEELKTSPTKAIGLRRINYYKSHLINSRNSTPYGELHYNCFETSPNLFVIELQSAPLVEPGHPNYYDPVSIVLLPQTPTLYFSITPYQGQIEIDQNDMFNYATYMNYGIDNNDVQEPRWQTFSSQIDINGQQLGPSSKVNPMCSAYEAQQNFIFSAVIGGLPGFTIDEDSLVTFDAEQMRQSLPTYTIWQ